MDELAPDMDPRGHIEWTPPLYPDTVQMQTGRDMLAEIVQLQTELQVKCMELAALEDERAVTVLELAEMRRLFLCANAKKREAVSAFLKYGRHDPECSAAYWFRPEGKKCDCGFEELNDAMRL